MTSWTTPRTWVTGEVLSSSNFNTHIRDNLIYYGGTDSLSTTPPATPGNGQEWTLPVDTGAGVFWHFKWSTTLSAWCFMGGTPLFKEITGLSTHALSTSYAAFSTPVSFTVPRAGVYRITTAAHVFGAAGHSVNVTPKLGGAAAADADSIMLSWTTASPSSVHDARTIERTLAANDVVQLMKKDDQASGWTDNVYFAALSVEPLRVT